MSARKEPVAVLIPRIILGLIFAFCFIPTIGIMEKGNGTILFGRAADLAPISKRGATPDGPLELLWLPA
jgi:hypothetical protein